MTASLAPGSRHPLPLRSPRLVFDASIPRHWMGGYAPATHFFNGMNLVFPEGERFFVRAVHDGLAAVSDPALREQARAFAGQEGRHAYEHERYFETLRAQGYAIDGFLRRFGRFCAALGRLPAPLRLAMTAGAEHYTALFGAYTLDDPLVLREAHPTMRRLIVWHACEEIEHKAVAFDVLRARHPGYGLRVAGFALATLALFGWSLAGARMLVRQDALPRRELARQQRALRRRDAGRLLRTLASGVARYLRPGFHPNESDELALAHARLREVGVEPASAGLSPVPAAG